MKLRSVLLASFLLAVALLGFHRPAEATHAWGSYHWARTANPFTLKLGNNLTNIWKTYLSQASADWSASTVLDTTVVSGSTNPKNCRPTSGRIEVCNSKYGNNGWLGLAQIWASGNHITQAVAKMNDTYFNTGSYNTPSWRQLVMCQEVAHGFGLDHQDELFNNVNLGTCMDYTSNPDGPPSNLHPNAHDFEQLGIIYAHLDSVSTVSQTTAQLAQNQMLGAAGDDAGNEPNAWGTKVHDNGNVGLYVRDQGNGNKVFTHVFWAK